MQKLNADKKTVVVTGASRGIGLSIARLLIDAGYFVIGVSRQESDCFQRLGTDASRAFVQYDFESLDGLPELVVQIKKIAPKIYGLVNNAGIGRDGILATLHQTDISKTIRVNLESPILLTKLISRLMIVQGEGRIVNVSSIIASNGFNGLSVYAASKAGLVGFSKSLSRELGKAGVTVNCVSPGFIKTEMTSSLGAERLESIRRRSPLALAEPDDVALAVIFLMSEGAQKITGENLTIDAGSTA